MTEKKKEIRKIVEIHQDDTYYEIREDLIGKTGMWQETWLPVREGFETGVFRLAEPLQSMFHLVNFIGIKTEVMPEKEEEENESTEEQDTGDKV
jgi:hypothetical protein